MPELYMKYAGPGSSVRRGATLNSDQEPNHWKTPTGFQCGLPGQHEQELSTMTAKLQKRMGRAQNNTERWRKEKKKKLSVYRGQNWRDNECMLGIF